MQLVDKTLQFFYSGVSTPLLFFIATVYPVITEPPFLGAFQVISTPVLEFTVVGASGTSGFAAALTFTLVESAPYPIELRAVTLKV